MTAVASGGMSAGAGPISVVAPAGDLDSAGAVYGLAVAMALFTVLPVWLLSEAIRRIGAAGGAGCRAWGRS